MPTSPQENSVRTRFAPSPTGFVHVGNLRTGLFAYLCAKGAGGTFILRLEDTDKKREVEGSKDHILKALKTLGIIWDEGVDVGGDFGPYEQSKRLEIYNIWAQKLINAGRAYADPYTSEEVQSFREQAQSQKNAFLYRNHRPKNPPKWDGTTPLRFKSEPKPYTWTDLIMGEISTGPEVIDDFVLIKSDGYPTYNFAHIVDDAEMKVSHIIRGQEFISSQPNYMNLYEALGLTPPMFASMPHIMNENGNKKLGKRDGAKDVLEYIKEGYLAETMVSFIATLGWNDGSTQEIFTMDELIKKFSLDHVQRSGAKFDERRLLWMNGQIIRGLSLEGLYDKVTNFWPESANHASVGYRKQVLALVQDRLKILSDLGQISDYFFSDPVVDKNLVSTNKQLKKLENSEIVNYLKATFEELDKLENWTSDSIQTSLNDLLDTTQQKPGLLFGLIRIVTTWAPFSPQLDKTLALIGRDTVLKRIKKAIDLYG